MIRCYTGLLGSGKSYSMVADAVKWLKDNRGMVYTNMAGLRFPEAVYFSGIQDIMGLRSGLVLLDEASVALSSRFWADVPREILTRFAQLRKHGLDLWYTAQDEARVDTVLREITNEFMRCRGIAKRFVARRVDVPGSTAKDRKGGLPDFALFDPVIYDLYDTMEVIATDGSSNGRADMEVPVSVAARKRSEDTLPKKGRAGLRAPVEDLSINMITGEIVKSKSAESALAWLRKTGRFRTDLPTRPQVVEELLRRRWLALFGYGPDDVPDDCSLSSPWLRGFDPATVEEKRRLVLLQRAQDMVGQDTSKRKRGGNTLAF